MQEPLNIETNMFYLDPKKKKNIYTGNLPTSKRRTRKSFWVFSKGHKTRKQENENKLAWMIEWQTVNTDEQSESISKNVKSVRNTYSPKLRLLA